MKRIDSWGRFTRSARSGNKNKTVETSEKTPRPQSPPLMQILGPEDKAFRKGLVKHLATLDHPEATARAGSAGDLLGRGRSPHGRALARSQSRADPGAFTPALLLDADCAIPLPAVKPECR